MHLIHLISAKTLSILGVSTFHIKQFIYSPPHRPCMIKYCCFGEFVPFLAEYIEEFIGISWLRSSFPKGPTENCPQVFYAVHVWRYDRPRKNRDFIIFQIPLSDRRSVWGSIVLLQDHVVALMFFSSCERLNMRSQNVLYVHITNKATIDANKRLAPTVDYAFPKTHTAVSPIHALGYCGVYKAFILSYVTESSAILTANRETGFS